MKRMIVWLLLVAMLLGAFAGCGSNTEQAPTQAAAEAAATGDIEGITAAIDYLKMFYKDSGSKTGADFERYGIVRIAGVPYEVTWTADVSEDLVKAVVNDDGSVTIDVSEDCDEDTPYVLTATITDDAGNTASFSWEYILPAGLGSDYCAIVDMAYALEKGAAMETPATLVGTVTAINTAWSEEYKNITVTIVVKGREDKPIECYRLKGEGAKDLAVGDLITVTGIIKNYNGKIEFDAGSEVVAIAKGAGDLGDIPTDPAEILTAAYALEEGAALPYTATLTGEVTGIDTPYSPDYKNVSVNIEVEGYEDMPILCYRMKGSGVETLMPGDTVTVTGTIKNYKGTIEFDAGCQAVSIVKGENSMEIPTDPNEILAAAVDLEPGEYLPYPVTLTGEIIGLGYGGYSEKYGNITVSLRVGDGYYVKCYRMKGVDIDKIWLGDEITVSGNLMDYDGTIEFDAGCIMESWTDLPNPKAPSDPKEIVKAAYKLSNFSTLPYYCTLTGEVTFAGNYSPTPGNRNIDMIVEGKKITCYKLSGEGVEGIKEGDTITVWGMLKNYWGTIEFDAGCKLVSKQSKVVDDLFDLEPGEAMKDEQVLTGKITSVKVGSGSSDVKFKVKGETIYCPGLTGYGYDKLEKKDTITVRGILENADGTYQFKKGSELQSWSNYNRPKVNAHTSSSKEIAYAATQLGTADRLTNFFVWGNVVRVDTPYDKEYGNVTVTIKVGDYDIQCFRMKGDGADKIGVGDKVGVSGTLINYKGTIEFTAGCKLVKYEIASKAEKENAKTAFAKDVEAAKNLQSGQTLDKLTEATLEITSNPSKGNYGGWYFYASDGTAEVLCYYVEVAGGNPAKGAKIKISGHLTKYGEKIEFTDEATCELISGGAAPTEPKEDLFPADSTLTVAQAIQQGNDKGHNEYTSGKYYVKGKITSISNTNYGNMYISDGTGEILIYGTFIDGKKYGEAASKPVVGDEITVYGIIGNYGGSPQLKNADITSFPAEEECTHKNTTTNTVDATCTAAGSKTVVCDDCGETVSTTPIDMLDHTYVEGVCGSCGAADPNYVAPEGGDDTTPEGGDDTTPEGGDDTTPEGGNDTTPEGGDDTATGSEETPIECEHVDENGDGTCDKCLENPEA